MRLVIYCYIETLKRHRKNYLPLTCNWVCHSKNTTKGDFIVPARRRLSSKHGGDLGALPPLGSPRIHSWRENEAAAPGYSTQELCMKKQISSRGNFCLLECLPCNPILWATSFGNAAQSGDWQRLKGKWFLSEDCRKAGHNLKHSHGSLLLSYMCIIINILVLKGYWTLAKNTRCCFFEVRKTSYKGFKIHIGIFFLFEN